MQNDFYFFETINFIPQIEGLHNIFVLSVSLFILGVLGICANSNRSVLFFMLCIEIILLSCVLNFILFSIMREDPKGQLYALFIITLAACESAVGLGLIISAYRLTKTIEFEKFETLRG